MWKRRMNNEIQVENKVKEFFLSFCALFSDGWSYHFEFLMPQFYIIFLKQTNRANLHI